jgi:hypothetical protein
VAATAKSDRVIADALESTAQISSLVRTTAVGVLAIAWGFLVTPSTRFPAPPPIIVLSVIALVISGLLVDWMQYVAAWLDSSARRRAMERDEELRGWNPNTFCYRCRTRCFVAKQVLVGLAAVLLVAGLAPSIIRLGLGGQ